MSTVSSHRLREAARTSVEIICGLQGDRLCRDGDAVDALQPNTRPRGAEAVLRPRHSHQRHNLGRHAPAAPLRIAWQKPGRAVIAMAIAPFAYGCPTKRKMARRGLEPMLLGICEDD